MYVPKVAFNTFFNREQICIVNVIMSVALIHDIFWLRARREMSIYPDNSKIVKPWLVSF